MTFKFKTPGCSTTTYTHRVDPELVKSSTGIYYVDVPLDATGGWCYGFAGTGNGAAAGEGRLVVRPSYFA